ncbi:hypothetical protein [Pseudomonas poae]|uniref:hypothetical protein n=1 Tax=Pseudomonas poae TaxID=200451 RepID=UPI0034D66292
MKPTLTIKAEVIDITKDTPLAGDNFLVDTNVWYWMTYSRASVAGAQNYQVLHYPQYTSSALSIGSSIFQSGLSLAELSHVIEKVEREMYEKSNAVKVSTKVFRHNYPAERLKVSCEIESMCRQVMSMSSSVETLIDEKFSQTAMSRISRDLVDGYDLFILETMSLKGLSQIITDDGDFATVSGIQVFTANKNVIAAASQQGKLITR